MRLTIKYFGMLAEVTQCDSETLEFEKHTVSELIDELFQKYPQLEKKDFQVAQDHELVSKDTEIAFGEIALLPPFSGG